MALTLGLEVGCAELQGVGGIRRIYLRSWATGDTVGFSNSTTSHSITSIKDTGASTADWYIYEFKDQTPVLNVTAAKENGSTSFEMSLNFTVPYIGNEGAVSSPLARWQEMLDSCMMAMALGNNGIYYVLGVSQKYRNESDITRGQTYASLSAFEGTTGAAYNDDNQQVLTLSCKQYELPRIYKGTVTNYTSGNKATTN